MFRSLLAMATIFCISSCGFKSATSIHNSNVQTLDVPYVHGDHKGSLTTQLVQAIEEQGHYRFTHSGGMLSLKVRIIDQGYDNIGYRFTPKKRKGDKRKLIASETRSKLLAEVSLIDNATKQTVLGPAYILTTNEYDHQNYSMNNDINIFSLGQLSDIDTTEDVLDIPLYRNLAKEIATFLQNHPLKTS